MRNQDQTASSGALLTLSDGETAAGRETSSVWRYQHTYSHLSLCTSLSSSLFWRTSAEFDIKANNTLEMMKVSKNIMMLVEKIKYLHVSFCTHSNKNWITTNNWSMYRILILLWSFERNFEPSGSDELCVLMSQMTQTQLYEAKISSLMAPTRDKQSRNCPGYYDEHECGEEKQMDATIWTQTL